MAGRSKSMGETIREIREMDLKQKLFRLKNKDGLQDTEENQDDSELKVIAIINSTAILGCNKSSYNILCCNYFSSSIYTNRKFLVLETLCR